MFSRVLWEGRLGSWGVALPQGIPCQWFRSTSLQILLVDSITCPSPPWVTFYYSLSTPAILPGSDLPQEPTVSLSCMNKCATESPASRTTVHRFLFCPYAGFCNKWLVCKENTENCLKSWQRSVASRGFTQRGQAVKENVLYLVFACFSDK